MGKSKNNQATRTLHQQGSKFTTIDAIVKDVDPTNKRILELERALCQKGDEVSILTSKLKSYQREALLTEALTEELHEATLAMPPFPKIPHKKPAAKTIVEDAVLHLSDEHADQIIFPHRVQNLETFNFNVVLARAEKLVNTVIEITQATLANYRFENLWIFANGDHVNGEIHDGSNHSEYRNVIRNSIAVGHMHALMIRDLAQYFKHVYVIYTPGNHGRRSKKKDYRGAWDHWDYLVAETAKLSTPDKTVEFLIPDSHSVNVTVRGWTFNISHGDDIKSWMGLPFYGLERQTRRLMALNVTQGRIIHYFVRGHFHQMSSIEHPGGETFINGSWKATDEYALEKLGAFCRPSQLLHGVHENHGVTWRLPIYIKFDGDTQGSTRYKVNLTTGTGE